MSDNKSAFDSNQYNKKIRQTLPYYDEFYKQVIELIQSFHYQNISWLDVGCGTGEMGKFVFQELQPKRYVFHDCSEKMIQISKERFKEKNAEFTICDIREMSYSDEFDVLTAIQVNHYFHKGERYIALQKCYNALKENGMLITFENFAPYTDIGKDIYLEKWKQYQINQGKSNEESKIHIERYGKDYFPITISEHIELMKKCGFRAVEILWLSNMQVGLWGIK